MKAHDVVNFVHRRIKIIVGAVLGASISCVVQALWQGHVDDVIGFLQVLATLILPFMVRSMIEEPQSQKERQQKIQQAKRLEAYQNVVDSYNPTQWHLYGGGSDKNRHRLMVFLKCMVEREVELEGLYDKRAAQKLAESSPHREKVINWDPTNRHHLVEAEECWHKMNEWHERYHAAVLELAVQQEYSKEEWKKVKDRPSASRQ